MEWSSTALTCVRVVCVYLFELGCTVQCCAAQCRSVFACDMQCAQALAQPTGAVLQCISQLQHACPVLRLHFSAIGPGYPVDCAASSGHLDEDEEGEVQEMDATQPAAGEATSMQVQSVAIPDHYQDQHHKVGRAIASWSESQSDVCPAYATWEG